MTTSSIVQVFKDYLESPVTENAILINGKWGTGKTFFWKENLSKIAREYGYEPIYISLNGINTREKLDELLFIELFALRLGKNYSIPKINIVLRNIFGSAYRKIRSNGYGQIIQDVTLLKIDYSRIVLCFDDLERCELSIVQVLGVINDFVEHKEAKTLILSNNEEVNGLEFKRLKEKLVGRELNYRPKIEEVFPLMIDQFENQSKDFFTFLRLVENEIIEILSFYDQKNLRNLKFILSLLEKLFPYINELEEKLRSEIILFIILISIEFKLGKFESPYDYLGLDQIDVTFEALLQGPGSHIDDYEKGDKEVDFNEIFFYKYLHKRRRNFFFYSSIFRFIVSGYLDASELKNDIYARMPIVTERSELVFSIIVNNQYRTIDDKQFIRSAKEVLLFAEKGSYKIYQYYHLGVFFKHFIDKSIIELSIEELDRIILIGLETSKRNCLIDENAMDSLLHFQKEDDFENKVLYTIKNIHNELVMIREKELSDSLIMLMALDDIKGVSNYFQDNKMNVNTFKVIDFDRFIDSLSTASNAILNTLIDALNRRYRIHNVADFLASDLPFLTSLKNSEVFSSNDFISVSCYLKRDLLDTINVAVEKLSNSHG